MKKIYSKVDSTLLLHQIASARDAQGGRIDVSDPKEFLQASLLSPEKGKVVHPHAHVSRPGEKSIVMQEAWIVIQGRIKGVYYDTDDRVIAEEILNPGDCSITFAGGHSLTILDEGTVFYEFKLGPYKGKEQDRRDIGV